jgi:methylmalonyl-CoA/ethylmalonyl-CoA epimerase
MIKGMNHIGIAVKDLKEAVDFFRSIFGATVLLHEKYTNEKIESTFVEVGSARLELTGSLDAGSVIDRFLEKNGEGIHHISLEVDDFDGLLAELKVKGLTIIGETDTEAFKAAFIHPKSAFGILLEIIEPKKEAYRKIGS